MNDTDLGALFRDAVGMTENPKPGLFIGHNSMTINDATMNAILTEWMRREIASPCDVTSCRRNDRTAGGFDIQFKVGA